MADGFITRKVDRSGIDIITLPRLTNLLYGNDEPGFLLNASPETCFTDTAGTTQAEPGDPVALWLDQSGNDNHAAQPTTVNRPILGRKPKGGVTAQSIGSGFDITEPGKPDVYYLFFGGASDPRWMQTPVITPGTDKAQVFAGARKLGNHIGRFVEHKETNDDGRFNLGVDEDRYLSVSRGTQTSSRATSSTYLPQHSGVFYAEYDISKPLNKLTVNGTVEINRTESQGFGDYLAASSFIGSREGVNRFFNGEISALTTRFGPNLTTKEIEKIEKFIASKVAEETIT